MYAVVTTKHRGVFSGLVELEDGDVVTLTGARMCVSWSRVTHGVLGLASQGPNKDCRIGPAVPRIRLRDVTAVIEMSDTAWAAWEAEPWT